MSLTALSLIGVLLQTARATTTTNQPPANSLTQTILVALAGGLVGFFVNWLLAERKEWHELRRSIAPARAEAYRQLWPLCRQNVPEAKRAARLRSLRAWYQRGGGLYLSLGASRRYLQAVALLERTDRLSKAENEKLNEHLTWLRTEMKQHVGSYSRREAKTQLPRDSTG